MGGLNNLKRNDMEKQFIPYEQALQLKELGFDEECLMNHYGKDRLHVGRLYLPPSFGKGKNSEIFDDCLRDGDITAILYQQAFRWFREKHKLDSFVKRDYKDTISIGYYYGIDGSTKDTYSKNYKTYEEAELECLKKLIEIAQVKGFPEQDN